MNGRNRTRAAAVCAVGLAAALALPACSSGDSSSDKAASSTAGGRGIAEGAAEGGAAAPAEQQGRDAGAKAPDLSVDQRSIIYTGSITVRVDDVNTAAARATGIATAAGGFVGGDKRNSNGDHGSSDATLTLRVPAEKFTSVVDQLAAIGTEERRGIDTEDVTEETIDLDARIATQQARVDSGRKLLAQAKSLSDLVMLEREVATRESDLASLQAKKRRLGDLTALSTITAVLLDPQAVAQEEDEGAPGFLAGLRNGWNGLLASLAVVATVVGWLLPWLLLLALPASAVLWYVRRTRRTRPPLEQERA
ncbi:DUF4349 domain-containing protein [Actinoplanes sp. NPDC049316]|uniref:DUF4349 domain-containing protein n=1 Tax=Actinoplanes sp. NPDC049316 TaxID=3154727 RepID=UPI0034331045